MFVLPLSRSAAPRARVVPAFSTALDRLFDESFDRYFGGAKPGVETRTPSMDVSESDAFYSVVLDVPGATRDLLKVSVEGRRVSLSSVVASEPAPQAQGEGEGEPAVETKSVDRVLYRERLAPLYARTIVLPTEVDQSASQAKFENGVLTLTLAKKVPAGATQLSIA
jgi:HSP20 family protein